MVKVIHFIWILSLMCSVPLALAADPVKVSAEVDQYHVYVNHPIKGSITITHDDTLKVDPASFQLEGKNLKVDFINDVKISPSSPTVVTIYNFEIDSVPAGLHILPEVSVKVGGTIYKSAPSTYEVSPASNVQPEPPPSSQTNVQQPQQPSEAFLKLDALYEGPTSLYPGQRGKLIYRFHFMGDIELRKEELPLFDAKGLLKIGEAENKEYKQGDESIQEISQIVQAVSPGKFSFGPSLVEGYAYQEDSLGKRTYSTQKLSAEAPIVTVTVNPFPAENKPGSFNGAVGKFTFKVSMLSPPQVAVGDKVVLSVEFSSSDAAALETVSMPDLCCLPGFSGMFRMSDVPPSGIIAGSTKTFTLEMQPLSPAIKEVPSIEFSYFDPQTGGYSVLHSQSIPLSVVDIKKKSKEEKPSQQPKAPSWPIVSGKPSAIETEGNFMLAASDLKNLRFGNWWVLWIIPFGIGLLWLQMLWRDYLIKEQNIVKPKQSKDLLAEAISQQKSPSFYHLLNRALLLRLYEKGMVNSPDLMPDQLPNEGIAGEVKAFLARIEEWRFGGIADMTEGQLVQEAQRLYNKIGADK